MSYSEGSDQSWRSTNVCYHQLVDSVQTCTHWVVWSSNLFLAISSGISQRANAYFAYRFNSTSNKPL